YVPRWAGPLQLPHPPIVLPADSDEGLETAARRRVPTGVAYRSVTRTKAIFDRYRAFAAREGWTPTPEHCLVLRHVYVAESGARARAEARPPLDHPWQQRLSHPAGSTTLLGHSPPTPTEAGRVAARRPHHP